MSNMIIPDSLEIGVAGIDCEVEFDFSPYEPARSDCPGADASVDIVAVKYGGMDITALCSPTELQQAEQDIMEQLSDLNDPDAYGDYLYDLKKDEG